MRQLPARTLPSPEDPTIGTAEVRVEEVPPRVAGQIAALTPLSDALAPTRATSRAATTSLQVTAPGGDITIPSDPTQRRGQASCAAFG